MSERVDICKWLRDLRHSHSVREIGDVGRGLHLAETEIVSLRDEIARLRLTDAERKALERQASWLASDESFACDMMRKDAAALRALLARLGGER